jgi:hypothetical protein
LPGLLATRLGADPVSVAKLLGLLMCGLAVLWNVREQRRRARGSWSSWIACFLLVCQPSLGGSGSSGLETGAATLALSLAIQAALARPRPHVACLGLAIASLAWLRPEIALVAVVLLTIASVRAGMRRAAIAWLWACFGALSVCAFRWFLSGSLLPLAWQAKAGTLGEGLSYSGRALLVLTGGLGCALAGAGAWLGQRRDRQRALIIAVHVLSVTLAGGDWMPGFRLFVPIFPQYAQLAAVGMERLWRRGHWLRTLALLALITACATSLLDLGLRVPEWRAAGASRDRVGAAMAEELRVGSKRVALVDIGYLGYASGCDVIDLAGITDPSSAALPGGHLAKRIPNAWLEARAPDTVVLHSSSPPLAARDGTLVSLHGYPVEMRVARSAWLAREFYVASTYAYSPHYHYAILRRKPR